MADKGNIINITGLVPGSDESHELQSIHPINDLIAALGNYLARSFIHHTPIEVSYFQNVINKKADEIEELKPLSFEGNQRVGELIATVSIAAAVNKINEEHGAKQTNFVAAWQKAGQNDSIEKFTGKGSWDGFIYEYIPLGSENPDIRVEMVGVEIKSLMINPKAPFTDLNSLLSERISEFSEHFQIKGSIAAILIPPYSNNTSGKISFNLKQATEDMNNNVGDVVGALVFIANENKDEKTTIATQVYLIQKDPKIVNGNIDKVEMVRIPFCRFEND